MENELEDWQVDLEQHIRQCQCPCNHMGYGNYWSYKSQRPALEYSQVRRGSAEHATIGRRFTQRRAVVAFGLVTHRYATSP